MAALYRLLTTTIFLILFETNLFSQVKISYQRQCLEYFLEDNETDNTKKTSIELVDFFRISGINNKTIERRINDQLLLLYCFPEGEFQSTILNNSNSSDSPNWVKSYLKQPNQLKKDSIYFNLEIPKDNDFYFSFCDSVVKQPNQIITYDNYQAKFIRHYRSCSFSVNWHIMQNQILAITISSSANFIPSENKFMKGIGYDYLIRDYSFASNQYTFMFDLENGNLLNFWDLIKDKKRYKFMAYFDKINNIKYNNQQLLMQYNKEIEYPDSFYSTILQKYNPTDYLDSFLFKPNYNFRKAGFFDHLGTNPMFLLGQDSTKLTQIYLYGTGRFGYYLVNPYVRNNIGTNSNYVIYQTEPVLLKEKTLRKYLKQPYRKLLTKR